MLADWNGLTIAALARASAVFGAAGLAGDRARRVRFRPGNICATATGGCCTPGGRGRPGARGLLDDYAAMARAALALFEASGEPAISTPPASSRREALDLFGDGAGGVYLTAERRRRRARAHVRATPTTARRPSGVGLLAEVFARLWHLTDEARWREAAESLIRAFSGAPEGLARQPAHC